MTTFRSEEEARLNTDVSSRVGLGLVFLGMAAFCAYAAFDGATVLGVFGAIAFVCVWLYYVSLEIVITHDMVFVRRFWRPVWQARRSTVAANFAMGGDLKSNRCLRLSSPDQKKSFDMLQSLFGKAAIREAGNLLGTDR